MNEHTLRVLEFDKVTAIVAGYAASAAGAAIVSGMRPAADPETVRTRLGETREFTRILESGESPPLDGIVDVGQAIEKLGVSGIVFTPVELLHTSTTLAAARRVRHFFLRYEAAAPLLCSIAAAIQPQKRLEDAVFAAIDERAEVRDSASPELRRIRRQIARTRDDILARMSGMLQDSALQKVVQEPVITVRDERYVLPLKPNFRQGLKGVVHGHSGSRATLFVEPLDVLEQNNRLAELRMEEQEEVLRILRELTALLSGEAEAIREAVFALSAIDAVSARSRFGRDLGGVVPELSSGRRIRLRRAVHPLLVWKQKLGGPGSVEPNDLELCEEQRTLIVSGPNAGGKTVVLKTVGLFSLMTQTGLPVTAAEGSELPLFGSVFADIGDEQSLEQDLSTFSSHVSQIAGILRQADQDSLVLLDELGSGTDPAEGAGLGAAVLESLIERGSMTLVTTHHNALKLFGSRTSGAVNAAMEFDPLTIKPTYRLIPGRPGRSYGLDMAARIGVPDEVVRKARERISEDELRLEDLLRQVESDAHRLAHERAELETELAAARQARTGAEAAHKAAQDEARQAKAKARAEAKEVVAALRQKLRELSRAAALEQAERTKAAAEIEALTRKIEPGVPEGEEGPFAPAPLLHPGDRVRIPRWNRSAVVLEARQGRLELDVDGKKIRLPHREVMPIEPLRRGQRPYAAPGWSADLAEQEGSSDRLILLGLRVDEAVPELERFIDRAGASGLSVLTIIHGLGTGALKAAVTQYLKDHPQVASLRPGGAAEGGAGVTIAELKR